MFLIFWKIITKICLLVFISIKLQLDVAGFVDALHLRKISSGYINPSFDALHLFIKSLSRKMEIIKTFYLN